MHAVGQAFCTLRLWGWHICKCEVSASLCIRPPPPDGSHHNHLPSLTGRGWEESSGVLRFNVAKDGTTPAWIHDDLQLLRGAGYQILQSDGGPAMYGRLVRSGWVYARPPSSGSGGLRGGSSDGRSEKPGDALMAAHQQSDIMPLGQDSG